MTKRCSLFLFFIAPVFLHASFEPVPGTARQAGLGESRNAVPNDVASLLTNPAGLVYLENPELTASYNKAITGLDDGSSLSRSFIGYASPHHLRYHNAGYGAGYFRTALGSLYSEETVSGSVAQEFWGRYSFGVTAKILRRSYGATGDLTQSLDSKTGGVSPEQDPLLAQSQETLALTGDMGALVSLNKWGRAGISLQNINRPNLATGDTYDPAPAVMNLGWAWAVRRMFLSANISSVHQKKNQQHPQRGR